MLCGVAIDSRAVAPGQLFVAIRGPRHDGAQFLREVAAAGAAAALVRADAPLPPDLPKAFAVVTVADTTAALGALAASHRARFRGPVVAITGSNGKTTTKEMCAAILARALPTLKTEGNLNNEFGLPLTLLRRRGEHRALVVELGMNHRGEIAKLARIARPTIAVLTNIGTAHIEHLGSREEIGREKGDLVAGLAPDGVAVLNLDDPRVMAQAPRAPGRVVRYGHDPAADVRAERVRFSAEGRWVFEIATPVGNVEARVPGLAETLVIDALAATAAALEAGAKLEHVAPALADFRNVGGRMARHRLRGGVELIDDTYNANPQSMRAALETLSQLKGSGRGFAVLGDMGELGSEAEEAHRALGRWASELGVDFLCAMGDRAERVAEGAAQAGMPRDRMLVDPTKDAEKTGRAVAEKLQPRDWVIVKGSRSMRMEKVVEVLARELGMEGA
jgi:UDP-N-acetylmuramoyl-tripeptide--D-alanyl-D-alanine ligase